MEGVKIAIQKLDIKDLDEVLSIEDSTSLHPWSRNMFAEEIRNPFTFCYVAREEDGSESRLFGYICFRKMAEESELLNIAVHPHYRELGIGKNLMQFYIDFCSRKGIKEFYLEVNSSNQSAIQLYQYFSYQSYGMRKKFYQGKFDALLMMKII